MERIRGIVLEIENRRAVIMTPDGDFKDVPVYRPDWEVGQEVDVPAREPIVLYDRPQRRESSLAFTFLGRRRQLRWPAALVAAAVLVAILVAAAPSIMVSPHPVYAAVSLDLNDNYRIYVDSDQNVVGASAASTDGMRFLNEIDYHGKPLDEVVDQLVKQEVTQGSFEPNKTDQVVLMSASVLDDGDSQEDSQGVAKLRERLEKATSRGKAKLEARDVDAEVAVVGIAKPDIQDRAGELGLTVNEYLILLKARDMGLDLSLTDMRGRGYVAKLRKQGASLQEVLAQVQQESDLAELSAKYHDELVNEWQNGKGTGHKQSEGDDVINVQPAQPGTDGDTDEVPASGGENGGAGSAPVVDARDESDAGEAVTPPSAEVREDNPNSEPAEAETPGEPVASKPGHGQKAERAEEKVGRWLKKLPPPGLLKQKSK